MPSKRASPRRSKSPKRTTKRKTASPKKGGALSQDLQNLAVPFALAVLSRGVRGQLKKTKSSHSGGDSSPAPVLPQPGLGADTSALSTPPPMLLESTPQQVGGKKKRVTRKSAHHSEEIKQEFMDITSKISSFLNKWK